MKVKVFVYSVSAMGIQNFERDVKQYFDKLDKEHGKEGYFHTYWIEIKNDTFYLILFVEIYDKVS